MTLEVRPASIEATDSIRKHGLRPRSIPTTYEGVKEGYREVVKRIVEEWQCSGQKKEFAYMNKEIQRMPKPD